MSVIDKKPLIRKVLQTLSKDDLVLLDSLVNGEVNNPVFRSLVPNSAHILSVADKGVKEVQLEVGLSVVQQLYNGYLIYNNNYCALIAYSAKKNADLNLLIMTQDNLGRWNYKITSCGLTILELRSELNDLLVEAGVNVKDSRIPDVTASDDGKVLVARGDSFALEELNSGNIVAFSNVAFDQDDTATLQVSSEQFDILKGEDNVVVVLELASGDVVTLYRTKHDSDLVSFGSVYGTTDGTDKKGHVYFANFSNSGSSIVGKAYEMEMGAGLTATVDETNKTINIVLG